MMLEGMEIVKEMKIVLKKGYGAIAYDVLPVAMFLSTLVIM